MSTATERRAHLLLIAVILLWGLNWPIMKIGLQHIGPLTFVAARMGLGLICMVGLLAALGRLHLPTRRDWPVVLVVGSLHTGIYTLMINIALQHVDAGRSAILSYTTPLWVVPAAMLLFGERLTAGRAVGLAVGLAGVLVLFGPGEVDWTDRDALIGNGLLLLAALIWAGQILFVRNHRWDSPPMELAPWQFMIPILAFTPLALIFEGDRVIEWNATLAAVLIYNGPIATAFCFVASIQVNRALPAITTSLGLLGVPATGLISAWPLLGETIGLWRGIGLVLILTGVATVVLSDRRGRAPAA